VRALDLAGIKKTLLLYQIDNGGVKFTYNYSGAGPGGWNLSSSASWLSFIGSKYGKIPVDPINTGVTDPSLNGLAYFYYCYYAGTGPMPATANVVVGYTSEASNSRVNTVFPVDNCL
jgi:hypothetical protein